MKSRRLGPNVAGSWYPAESDELAERVDAFLGAAGDERTDSASAQGRLVALIAPHAGYVYSGLVAGRGFRHLRGAAFTRVLLLGPSHHAGYSGAVLPRAEVYVTPLGEVPIDAAAVERLRDLPGLRADDGPFRPEHCLEMEIPFLQRTLEPGWRLLPVLVGAGGGPDTLEEVADALSPFVDSDTLIVVSSDFTHYGPRFSYVPFRSELPARIRELDLGAVERILALDRTGFEQYVGRTGATICGRRAIDLMLRLLPADLDGHLEAYDTSGRITGDWDHSVSYASLLFRASGADPG
jgi:AmmeMemoRadiSam system protein B